MGRLEWIPVARNKYVEKRKAKKKKPRSEETKRRISESLSGMKIGGQESFIDVRASEELRRRVRSGDNFKHQALIDWWRDLKG